MTMPARERCCSRRPPDLPADQRREPDWAGVHRELRRPDVTLTLLWEEYRASAPDGFGYSWFCDLYKDWAGRLKPTLRQVHVAGERLFVDYRRPHHGGDRRRYRRGAAGRRSSSPCSAPPATPTPRRASTQTLPDWIAAHVRAFAFFGGAAAADRQRQSQGRHHPGLLPRADGQPHLRRHGAALRHGHRPGAALQAARQSEGRGRRPGGRALDPGAAAATAASSRSPSSTRRSANCSIDLNDRPMRGWGTQPARAVRAARPAGAAAAAGRALRIRRVEALPGQPRLPCRDRQALTTACRISCCARRSRRGSPRPRSRSSIAASGSPRICAALVRIGRPPSPSTCRARIGAIATGRTSAEKMESF